MNHFWLTLIVILTGSAIQGIAGFGFGMVSVGLLVLFLPADDAVGLVALLSLVSIGLNLAMTRRDIDWAEAWPLIASAVPASILGVILVEWLPAKSLDVAVAVMILLGVPTSLWKPDRIHIRKAWPWAPISGLLSGLLGGLVEIDGPPVVFYTQLRGWDKGLSKAILSACFLVTTLLRAGLRVPSGIITAPIAATAAMLAVPTLGTAWLGHKLFERMSTKVFRYVTSGMLILLAIRIIVTEI